VTFRSILISGTDTGVGKTTVACGLAAAFRTHDWRVGVFKPAETGCSGGPGGTLRPADALRLRFFSECRLDVTTICPYALPEPLAPLVAAERDGTRIDLDTLARCYQTIVSDSDITLIEGAGGLLVPLTTALTFADLAACLDVAVLVVVGSRLGAINHALLTMRYAHLAGLDVLGYVVNFLSEEMDLPARTNTEVLTAWLGPPIGVVPFLGDIELSDAGRARLAEVFSTTVDLNRLLIPAK
jgi:dethiobiotin synthetase